MTVRLHPGLGVRQIRRAVRDAVAAARFVRNAYYPLVEPGAASSPAVQGNRFDSRPLAAWLPELCAAVLEEGSPATSPGGRVNSAELFLQKVRRRIVNSQGVDVSFPGYDGYLELIVESASREVELQKELTFADFDLPWLRAQVRRQLELCADRAVAGPTPRLDRPSVLLTAEAVRELFGYYLTQTAAESVYSGVSRLKAGDSVQGAAVSGDRLSISLEPHLPNSAASAPWDDDGFALSPVAIVEDGTLHRLWGPQRFCYYLGVPPTGNVPNVSVRPGAKPLAELRERAALEVAAFSDFQVEPVTGDFGAEIRLAYTQPGRGGQPVTGGSVSGNLREVQGELYLSRELQRGGAFLGPAGILFPRLSLSGVEGPG
jgi:PmbA protein